MKSRQPFWQKQRSKRLAEKKKCGKCLTPYCRNLARSQRNYCNTCRGHKYDKPLRRLFRNLKSHAKRRGKQFALTWDWFAKWATESGYLEGHGCQGFALTVDRIDHRQGYLTENIQSLTKSENSSKGWHERHGKPWKEKELETVENPF